MNRNWTELLKDVIPPCCINQRPFVCDGFPDKSEVIVIGQNPRNALGVDWWHFWDNSSGFDYCRFSDVYQEKGYKLKTGTRGRLNKIKDRGVKCVETNVFRSEGVCKQNERSGIIEGIENQSVLEVLLRNMPHLEWVIAHGKIARDWVDVDRNKELIPLPNERILKFPSWRNISDDEINRICEQIENARYQWVEEGKQLLHYKHITLESAIDSKYPKLEPKSKQDMLWEQSNAARNWSNRVEHRFGAQAFVPYPYLLHSFKDIPADVEIEHQWSQCKAQLNNSINSLEKLLGFLNPKEKEF